MPDARMLPSSQKCLAVRSARRTAPETANTATMLIRLLRPSTWAMRHWPAAGLPWSSCASPFVMLFWQTLYSRRWRVRPLRPDPDAFPVEVRPDLQPPSHASGRRSLMRLVNQS